MRYVWTPIIALSAFFAAAVACADEEAAGDDIGGGKHRIDITYLDLETFDTNVISNVVLFGYTQTFNSSMRVGIRSGIASVADSPSPDSAATQKTTDVGLSDTTLTFQYDFSQRLTASPWIPNTLGMHAQLSVPTGEKVDGLGIDSWLLSLGAGWGINLFKEIWIQPAVGYEFTFSEGSMAVPSRLGYASMTVIWLSPSGFWVGYAPTISYELENSEWLHDRSLTVGKMFRNGLGLSLDYGNLDRVGPVAAPDDAQLVINFYYQFGN
jgi:hypothetical protein